MANGGVSGRGAGSGFVVQVFNRQKTRRVSVPFVRQVARRLLAPAFSEGGQLAIHLVGAEEMACLNEQFLGHAGSTDVITFDYRDDSKPGAASGEIFISVDDAVKSAPRFRTTWRTELIRYLVHGVLHLQGFDDTSAAARRVMKREENRRLKELSRRFDWGKLEKQKNVAR